MSNDGSIRKRDRRVRQEAMEEFFHNDPSHGAPVSTVSSSESSTIA